MASLMYASSAAYNGVLRAVHGRFLEERYRFIACEIGEGARVLDLGCGTCLLAQYLHPSCRYEGWDLNRRFVRAGRAGGLRVREKDVFEYRDYPACDAIVLTDILHHVAPRHTPLLNEALHRCKTVVVAEPCVSGAVTSLYHRNSKSIVLRWAVTAFHTYLADNDGINPVENVLAWYRSERELMAFYGQYTCRKVARIGQDLIAVLAGAE